MNVKKYLLVVATLVCTVAAFAYPAMQEDDPVNPLVQHYAAQAEELQKTFEKNLLPVLKDTAQLALQIQRENPAELSSQQEAQFTHYGNKIDAVLTQMVAPVVKEINLEQFNQEYEKMSQDYNLPKQHFTEESLTDLFKGAYLISAIAYFEQTQKLSEDELTVLMELLFPQEEEE